jgi:hypothetical protein
MANKTNIKGVNTGGGTPPSCDSEIAGVSYFGIDGVANSTFDRIGDFNLKPSYGTFAKGVGGHEITLQYNGSFWYSMRAFGSIENGSANPGNENYPWEATWPAGYGVTKLCP